MIFNAAAADDLSDSEGLCRSSDGPLSLTPKNGCHRYTCRRAILGNRSCRNVSVDVVVGKEVSADPEFLRIGANPSRSGVKFSCKFCRLSSGRIMSLTPARLAARVFSLMTALGENISAQCNFIVKRG